VFREELIDHSVPQLEDDAVIGYPPSSSLLNLNPHLAPVIPGLDIVAEASNPLIEAFRRVAHVLLL
jgi:hypothetical protein